MPLNDDPNYLAYTIGVKIATGMQILLSEGSKLKNSDSIEPKQFEKFIQKLSAVDYFEGQMEGSARYNTLLERAKLFFKETLVTPDDEQKNESHRRQAARNIATLYNKKVAYTTSKITDESLDWLNLDEKDFLDKLSSNYEWKKEPKTESKTDQMEQMTDQLKSFVSKSSDLIDGVENENLTEGLSLDPAKFSACIDRLVGETRDSDDESDYLDSDDLESETEDYYAQMADQLEGEKVMAGLVKSEDVEEGVKDKKLSVDLNLVAGMLKSFESQMGLSGPAGNVMKSIGLDLPE